MNANSLSTFGENPGFAWRYYRPESAKTGTFYYVRTLFDVPRECRENAVLVRITNGTLYETLMSYQQYCALR